MTDYARRDSVKRYASLQLEVKRRTMEGKQGRLFEPFLIDLKKGFKMLLCALVIKGRLWVPCTVVGGGRCQ
jgi:hypothetical protein